MVGVLCNKGPIFGWRAKCASRGRSGGMHPPGYFCINSLRTSVTAFVTNNYPTCGRASQGL